MRFCPSSSLNNVQSTLLRGFRVEDLAYTLKPYGLNPEALQALAALKAVEE